MVVAASVQPNVAVTATTAIAFLKNVDMVCSSSHSASPCGPCAARARPALIASRWFNRHPPDGRRFQAQTAPFWFVAQLPAPTLPKKLCRAWTGVAAMKIGLSR